MIDDPVPPVCPSWLPVNVEMQMLALPHYEARILFYWARLHGQQLRERDDYRQLRPTVSISFLGHVLFPRVREYHLRFRLEEM